MASKVLVVDDSEAIRQSVSYILEQSGYEVTTAEDGADGLKKLESGAFSLIITDVNMPNMDGIELTRQVRAQDEHKFLPIIVLTTESQGAKMDEGKKAGATGWIVKPFNAEKLLAVVKKVAG